MAFHYGAVAADVADFAVINNPTLEWSEAVVSAAGAVWDGITASGTATVSGSTNITTAAGFNAWSFAQPTISAALALTVSNAATVTILGAPVGGGAGPASITNAYALWVQAGVSRFGGAVYIPAGTASVPSLVDVSAATTGVYFGSSRVNFALVGVNKVTVTTGFRLSSDATINWTSSTTDAANGTVDLSLARNAAGILDLHNTTATSTQFNIWNTRTSATVGEWLEAKWDANVAFLRTAHGSASARLFQLRCGNSTSVALQVGTGLDNGLVLINTSIATTDISNGAVYLNGGTITSNSGTAILFRVGNGVVPTGSSTLDVRFISVAPTINYASGGAGRVQLARFAPTNTALPTGPNAAIVLSDTASTLGGIDLFATSDETTNYEALKLSYVSGNTQYELVSRIGGTGTLRDIATSMGAGTGRAKLLGTANTNTTAVGNVGAGADDLITYAMPADSFKNAGKRVHIKAWGTTANNANAKTVILYFGTQAILTNALTASIAGIWRIEADVISTGTDTQDWVAQLVTTGAAGVALNDVEVGTATQDDGAAITIKCTGTATANDDIKQEGLIVEFSA